MPVTNDMLGPAILRNWLWCACGSWLCSRCLYLHTSAQGGRCPEAMRQEIDGQPLEQGSK